MSLRQVTIFVFSLLSTMAMQIFAQEMLRPEVAPVFGIPVIVKGEFVSKPNYYYSQNMVREKFFLKVISVDGKRLEKPVSIEYKRHLSEDRRPVLEDRGEVVTVEAYESVYEAPSGGPWLGKGQQGHGFALINVLHIRPISGKDGNQRKDEREMRGVQADGGAVQRN